MFYYNVVLLFILGMLVGSFLSVVITRLDTDEGFVKGRSRCPRCKAKLLARDLIPVLSFLVLKGKCRKCQKKISWFYPFIEIICGTLFAFTYMRFYQYLFGANLYLFSVLYLYIIAVLLIIFVFDWVNYIIPDKVLVPAGVVVCLALIFNIVLKPLGADFIIYHTSFLNFLLGLLIGGGFFFVLVAVSKERWMGWGDVKLGSFLGLILGYPLILITIMSSVVVGAIYGLALMAFGKKKLKDPIPFGPFLVIGALIAIFAGRYILAWYLGG